MVIEVLILGYDGIRVNARNQQWASLVVPRIFYCDKQKSETKSWVFFIESVRKRLSIARVWVLEVLVLGYDRIRMNKQNEPGNKR